MKRKLLAVITAMNSVIENYKATHPVCSILFKQSQAVIISDAECVQLLLDSKRKLSNIPMTHVMQALENKIKSYKLLIEAIIPTKEFATSNEFDNVFNTAEAMLNEAKARNSALEI
jgi:hypothetical protein